MNRYELVKKLSENPVFSVGAVERVTGKGRGYSYL